MDTVKVLEDYLGDYDSSVTAINDELSKVDTTMNSISALLNSDSWKGYAHDKCLEAFNKINQYQTDTNTCYEELKTAIKELIDNTDSYVDNSTVEAKLA